MHTPSSTKNCNENVTNSLLSLGDDKAHRSRVKFPFSHRQVAFTLLELLIVIAVMLLMVSMLLPAISGIAGSTGRRGAVNVLMNSFEQARVAALESGQNVYIGFADDHSIFTAKSMNYAAFIIFRETTDEEKAANSSRKYVVLKPWTRLPKKISFQRVNESLIPTAGGTIPLTGLKDELGSAYQSWNEQLPCIEFNSTGAVEYPDSSKLHLYLYENSVGNNLWEKISVSKYTGRVQLDITGT